jgi:hypothetical protein
LVVHQNKLTLIDFWWAVPISARRTKVPDNGIYASPQSVLSKFGPSFDLMRLYDDFTSQLLAYVPEFARPFFKLDNVPLTKDEVVNLSTIQNQWAFGPADDIFSIGMSLADMSLVDQKVWAALKVPDSKEGILPYLFGLQKLQTDVLHTDSAMNSLIKSMISIFPNNRPTAKWTGIGPTSSSRFE